MPTTYPASHRKKLIEVALPLDAINTASAREKSIRHGHPSTLHLWWARRPLATARAILFAQLVDDPDAETAPPAFVAACRDLPAGKHAAAEDTARHRLFDFIGELVTWENTTNEAVLKKAHDLIMLSTDGNPPPVLDPFSGGATIPLEAQRLGLEAHGSDLNPVAVMIGKASIEIPPRFAGRPPVHPTTKHVTGGSWKGAQGLAEDVRYYGRWMKEEAERRIGHLYPKAKLPDGTEATVIAWLWARTVASPDPQAGGAHVPLVRSFELSTKTGKEIYVEPVVDGNSYRFEVRRGKVPANLKDGTLGRTGATCILTGTPFPLTYIRAEGKAGRMGARLMAVVAEGACGRVYINATKSMEDIASTEEKSWRSESDISHWPGRTNVVEYGMTKWGDLFTSRQLVALTTFSDLVAEARAHIREDARKAGLEDDDIPLRDGGKGARGYAEAVSIYLAFVITSFAI